MGDLVLEDQLEQSQELLLGQDLLLSQKLHDNILELVEYQNDSVAVDGILHEVSGNGGG